MPSPPPHPTFDVVLRGYARKQVDECVARARAALAGGPGPAPVTAEQLRATLFDVVLRGYDRKQVDDYCEGLANDLAAAESRNGRG